MILSFVLAASAAVAGHQSKCDIRMGSLVAAFPLWLPVRGSHAWRLEWARRERLSKRATVGFLVRHRDVRGGRRHHHVIPTLCRVGCVRWQI